MSTFRSGPSKQRRSKKRWPILLGALLGAVLPVLLEAGILGLQSRDAVRQMCVGLLHADALKEPPLKSSNW
jgi:hypothetical protein